jgi:hypothetical protein
MTVIEPKMFVSKLWRRSSSLSSSNAPSNPYAALFTSTSIRPKPPRGFGHRSTHRCCLGHIEPYGSDPVRRETHEIGDGGDVPSGSHHPIAMSDHGSGEFPPEAGTGPVMNQTWSLPGILVYWSVIALPIAFWIRALDLRRRRAVPPQLPLAFVCPDGQ